MEGGIKFRRSQKNPKEILNFYFRYYLSDKQLHVLPPPGGSQMNGLLGVVCRVGVHPAENPRQMLDLRQREKGGYKGIRGLPGEENKDQDHTDCGHCNKQL